MNEPSLVPEGRERPMPGSPSITRNITVNYVSQIYLTLVGIVMVPMYMKYMGAEAYGLVGFFAVLQSWFQLLDFGLTPTIAREVSRFRGGAGSAAALRHLLRALEAGFLAVAVLAALVLVLNAEGIAHSWLKVKDLPLDAVTKSVALMGVISGLRLVSGLYRGVVSGFEGMVWLGGVNMFFATARFVLVIPIFTHIGTSPEVFFGYQFAVAALELVVVVSKAYRLFAAVPKQQQCRFSLGPIRGVLRFSAGIAVSGIVWIVVTQVDKLLLSKMLSLEDYGYFSLVVLVAGGVLMISGPISMALVPRLTLLSAQSNELEFVALYRTATQLLAAIAIPAALVLAVFTEQVLWIWTGNAELAARAAPVLRLYALGNCILVIGAFPYYLQVAKGDLKLHLIGNLLFVAVFVPVLFVAAWRYGARGAGYSWLVVNLVYFMLWVPKIHRKFVNGLHRIWLTKDLGPPLLYALGGMAALDLALKWPSQRIAAGIVLVSVSVAMLALTTAGTPAGRSAILKLRNLLVEKAKA